MARGTKSRSKAEVESLQEKPRGVGPTQPWGEEVTEGQGDTGWGVLAWDSTTGAFQDGEFIRVLVCVHVCYVNVESKGQPQLSFLGYLSLLWGRS